MVELVDFHRHIRRFGPIPRLPNPYIDVPVKLDDQPAIGHFKNKFLTAIAAPLDMDITLIAYSEMRQCFEPINDASWTVAFNKIRANVVAGRLRNSNNDLRRGAYLKVELDFHALIK